MFTLIIALAFNPVNHQVTWFATEKTFSSDAQCVAFAESEAGQRYMTSQKSLAYNCDTLKGTD